MSAYRELGAADFAPTHWPLDPTRVTTLEALPGHPTVRALGVARGFGRMQESGLALGQKVEERVDSGYHEAFGWAVFRMMEVAVRGGANAVVGMRVEIGAWADGVPVCLAYGTAVLVE
jgi:uncharacterized protein YbjQ (UPF0145 family)